MQNTEYLQLVGEIKSLGEVSEEGDRIIDLVEIVWMAAGILPAEEAGPIRVVLDMIKTRLTDLVSDIDNIHLLSGVTPDQSAANQS
ncbi:hypothetical protein ASD54_10945 [Rhizobium sp. Root149]|uniref:hypothetical protein n=1 Tax=Rhizobium sp. Root149 TaxID=1736473 RepID=UPI0007125B8A|nr:hypothetical protein [Rhizobium sp. Root149]KQZ50718.1 hypothetical protein ASD54_10945 [Rhizobium sp. Root149]